MQLNNTGANNYYYWDNGTANSKYSNTFAYNANGNIMKQDRRDENNSVFDSLTYKYSLDGAGKKLENRLYQVNDLVALTGTKGDDIDNQSGINYNYDAIGNLTSDIQEEITTIDWTVSGKIKMINRSQGSTKADLEFKYDPMGNRIAKIVKPAGSSINNGGNDDFTQWTITYYVRDAQGNEMATYEETNANSISNFFLKEHPIYGSSRVGLDKNEIDLILVETPPATGSRYLGNKFYELNNHLGNVLVTVTDKKIPVQAGTSGIVDYYLADVASASDYYPGGIMIPERSFNTGSYRFGFNGKEKDDEVKGVGNSLDFGARIYDGRLGRWLSLDPLMTKYPNLSPYNFCENNPVYFKDTDGKDAKYTIVNGTITFQCKIFIEGSGATAAKANEIQDQIMAKWGGLNNNGFSTEINGKPYNVKFDISVAVIDPAKWEIGSSNVVALTSNDNVRSFVTGNTGVWTSKADDNDLYGHEAGHFLGLADQYCDEYVLKDNVAKTSSPADYSCKDYKIISTDYGKPNNNDLMGKAASNKNISGVIQPEEINALAKFAISNGSNVKGNNGTISGQVKGGLKLGFPDDAPLCSPPPAVCADENKQY